MSWTSFFQLWFCVVVFQLQINPSYVLSPHKIEDLWTSGSLLGSGRSTSPSFPISIRILGGADPKTSIPVSPDFVPKFRTTQLIITLVLIGGLSLNTKEFMHTLSQFNSSFYRSSTALCWLSRKLTFCNPKQRHHHHQHTCLGCQIPRWPWRPAPRQLSPNDSIQGINHGPKVAWVDPVGSNCPGSAIWSHLGFWHPRPSCWGCIDTYYPLAPLIPSVSVRTDCQLCLLPTSLSFCCIVAPNLSATTTVANLFFFWL